MLSLRPINLQICIALTLSAACGPDAASSTDESGTTGGSSGPTATTQESSSSQGMTSDSIGTVGTAAADSGSDGGSATEGNTTGAIGECDSRDNCQEYPAPCTLDDTCGTAPSVFDESGCLRTPCSNDEQCGADQRCFVGQDFGICESSVNFCMDDPAQQACLCGGTDDCSGGHCIPAALWPSAESVEGDMIVENGCAPDDGPSVVFRWVDMATGCDAPDPASDRLLLAFYEVTLADRATYTFGGTSSGWGAGTYRLGNGDDVTLISATVTLTATDGLGSGHYEAVVNANADGVTILSGDFEAAPVCAQVVTCG